MKLKLGRKTLICQGPRPEEALWGPYQFPHPYDLGDRLVVTVHVTDDDMKSFGNPNRWFESHDKGITWKEISPEFAAAVHLDYDEANACGFHKGDLGRILS